MLATIPQAQTELLNWSNDWTGGKIEITDPDTDATLFLATRSNDTGWTTSIFWDVEFSLALFPLRDR